MSNLTTFEPLLFDNQEWLTTNEAAEFLRISVGSLRNMTSCGEIPYHKLGTRNRYLKSDLNDLLLKNKKERF